MQLPFNNGSKMLVCTIKENWFPQSLMLNAGNPNLLKMIFCGFNNEDCRCVVPEMEYEALQHISQSICYCCWRWGPAGFLWSTFSYPCHIRLKGILQTNKNFFSFVTNISFALLLLLFQTRMTYFEYTQSNFIDFLQCFSEGKWGLRLSVTNIFCYTEERTFAKTLQWGCIQ